MYSIIMGIKYTNIDGYNVLSTGWGCECPQNTEIETAEECLAVASQILSSNNANNDGIDTDARASSTELILSENKWRYGPCGCFIWKGGRKVYYTGDRNDLHCVAVQWAELICKTNGEDRDPVLATEIADYSPTEWTNQDPPEEEPRRCLDWAGDGRFVHLKEDRNFCIVIEDSFHGSDGKGKDEERHLQPQYPLVLKPCNEVPLEDAWIYYSGLHNFLFLFKDSVDFCLASSGKEIGSPIIVERCAHGTVNEHNLQKWTYDSNGRFRNVGNGGYIGVQQYDEGRKSCTDGMVSNVIITSTIQGDEDCDLSTQWLPYNNYNDEISMGRLWTTVIAIYGPLLISIICMIVVGSILYRRQQRILMGNHRRMRRPGMYDSTIEITTFDSSLRS